MIDTVVYHRIPLNTMVYGGIGPIESPILNLSVLSRDPLLIARGMSSVVYMVYRGIRWYHALQHTDGMVTDKRSCTILVGRYRVSGKRDVS
jgi:hypothetical protein